MPENQQIIEPLAKFHARVDKSGRIIIPKYIRDTFDIKENDFIVLIIRLIKIDRKQRKIYVSGQFRFSGKVNAKGVVVLPKQLRKKYQLSPGQLIEVLLVDHHKPEDEDLTTTYSYVFL